MGYRRRHNQNVRDYSREQVASAVAERMKIRHHLLAPCPLKPVDIYRHLWTKEERAALRTLKDRMPSILRKDNDVTLEWDVRVFQIDTPLTDPRVPVHLFVNFGTHLPLPCTDRWSSIADTLKLSRLPEPMLHTLEEWGRQWLRLEIERECVIDRVEQVFNACNTMGQIHRLWPNLCSFLPERAQEILRKKKVRSKLPEAVMHYDDEKDPENEHPILDDEWTPKRLAPYDALITEALLLPEHEVEDDWSMRIVHGSAC